MCAGVNMGRIVFPSLKTLSLRDKIFERQGLQEMWDESKTGISFQKKISLISKNT